MTAPELTAAPDRPWPAAGLAAGPVAFVAAWVVGGAAMGRSYSPVHDAISRIAAVGSPERVTMTTGFLVYGGTVIAGATALRGTFLHRCWPLALVNGAATIAVAATPLDHSSTVDLLHGLSATVGYLSITALPIAAAGPLHRRGFRRAAALSVVGGAVSAVCLALTASSVDKGLYQRLGLLSGDVWLVAVAVALLRGRLAERPSPGS